MTIINVIKDGQKGQIDIKDLLDASKEGWRLETDDETEGRLWEEEASSVGGVLSSTGLGMARGLTFGISDLALSGIVDERRISKLKELNPYSSVLGEVAGIAGGALLSGGAGLLGKGAQAATTGVRAAAAAGSVAESVAARAVKSALGRTVERSIAARIASKAIPKAAGGIVEGTFYATGQLVSEQALGDTELTAEKLAAHYGMSSIIGGAVGGGFGGLGALLQPAKSTALAKVASGAVTEYADDVSRAIKGEAQKAAGKGVKGRIGEFAEDRALKSMGLRGSDIKNMKGGLTRARTVAREALDYTLGNGKKIFEHGDDVAAVSGKLATAREEVGRKIGKAYDLLDDVVKATGQADKYAPNIERMFSKIDDVVGVDIKSPIRSVRNSAKKALAEVDELRAMKRGENSFKDMHAIRRRLDENIYGRRASLQGAHPRTKMLEKIRMAVEDEIVKSGDEVAKLSGYQDYAAQFKKLKQTYGNLAAASDISSKRSGMEVGNRFFSLSDNIAGVGAVAGDMASGGSIGAIAKGLGLGAIHKIVRERGSTTAALLADKVSRMGVIEKASSTMSNKISSSVAGMLGTSAGRVAARSSSYAVPTAVSIFNATGFSRESGKKKSDNIFEKYASKRDELSEIISNPQKFIDQMSVSISGSHDVAPEISQHLAFKAVQAAGFLHSKMPQPPQAGLTPLANKWKPSKHDIEKWSRYARAANDPSTVIEDLRHGHLTSEAVETIMILYPRLYEEIKQEIAMQAAESTEEIPYSKRVELSMFFGGGIEHTMDSDYVQWLQSSYKQDEAVEGRAGPSNLRAPGLDDMDMAGRAASRGQEIGNA